MRLGVNIDHVATLRQARKGRYPDPVAAAALAELGGADQITLHVREDRRHVNDRDLDVLRKTVNGTLNLEMAAVQPMLNLALQHRPDTATLVPERREELTTEGGLDVISNREEIRRVAQSPSSSTPTWSRSRPATAPTPRPSSCTPVATARRAPRGTAPASWPASSKAPRRRPSSGSASPPATASTTGTSSPWRRSPRSPS